MAATRYAQLPAEVRFWGLVDKTGPCWSWLGTKNQKGYGVFTANNHREVAHRVAWRLSGRELVPGLTLDHLCRNRSCVRPEHMEQVTIQENMRRGIGLAAIAARATQCPSGHLYDDQNTIHRRNGSRRCRICRAVQRNRWLAKRRLAALSEPREEQKT